MKLSIHEIHEKVKQHWGWVKKNFAYKKACISSEIAGHRKCRAKKMLQNFARHLMLSSFFRDFSCLTFFSLRHLKQQKLCSGEWISFFQLKHDSQIRLNIKELTEWNLWKTAFKKIEVMNRPYHFKFFKGCLPQISLGPFLNTLFQIRLKYDLENSSFHLL